MGATRRFLGAWSSPVPPSASRLVACDLAGALLSPSTVGVALLRPLGTANEPPATPPSAPPVANGVIGGVGEVNAGCDVPMLLCCAAATLGSLPNMGVGLLITPLPPCGANDDCVATELAELLLVGLAGRTLDMGDGEGANKAGICRGAGAVLPCPGACACVGVWLGVE